MFTRLLKIVNQENGTCHYNKDDVITFLMKQCNDGMSKASMQKSIPAINSYSAFINLGIEIKINELPLLEKLEEAEPIFYVLSIDVQEQMYKYAKRVWKKRNIAMILILLETGIKLSELVALNKNDLITINNSPYIMVNQRNKRTLRITEDLFSVIQHSLNVRTDHSEALFVSNVGSRIGERTVQQAIKGHGVAMNTQLLRDTYIYNLMSNDVDTYEISQLAGITYSDAFNDKYFKKEPEFINELIEITDVRDPNMRTKLIKFERNNIHPNYGDLNSFVKKRKKKIQYFMTNSFPIRNN